MMTDGSFCKNPPYSISPEEKHPPTSALSSFSPDRHLSSVAGAACSVARTASAPSRAPPLIRHRRRLIRPSSSPSSSPTAAAVEIKRKKIPFSCKALDLAAATASSSAGWYRRHHPRRSPNPRSEKFTLLSAG
jgi:hypothetical protein